MFTVRRRLRVTCAVVTALMLGVLPSYAEATTSLPVELATQPTLLITEFQTNGGVAAREFIELYNTTDNSIDFSSSESGPWRIQFFASAAVKAGAPNWSTAPSESNSILLSGSVPAHEYFLLASTDYKPAGVEADQYYSASGSHLMTDTGGGLQLLNSVSPPSGLVAHDRVMWLDLKTNPNLPPGVLAKPESGKSLQRMPDENMEYVQADESFSVFSGSDEPTPLNAWRLPEQVPDTTSESGDNQSGEDQPGFPATDNTGLSKPVITELLPNPGSPLTDADDEFIELYNPNSAAFNLSGYSIEVGTTTLHSYTFPAGTILQPNEYHAYYSSETRLSLSNSGGQVRTRDMADVVLDETMIYGAAKDNQVWVQADGTWSWSTTSTPGRANILSSPEVDTKTAVVPKLTTAKTTKPAKSAKTTTQKSAKKSAVKKVKAKTAKKKKSKSAKVKTAALSTASSIKKRPPIHTGVLVAVAATALLYALYEYRCDIADKFRQFRENRANRGRHGQRAAWRRGYSTD